MAKNTVSKKLETSAIKIANIVDFLLTQDGHHEWEIDQIHLTPKNVAGNNNDSVVCKYVKEGGEWVLKCTKGN